MFQTGFLEKIHFNLHYYNGKIMPVVTKTGFLPVQCGNCFAPCSQNKKLSVSNLHFDILNFCQKNNSVFVENLRIAENCIVKICTKTAIILLTLKKTKNK